MVTGRFDTAVMNLEELNAGWAEAGNAPHALFQRLRYELLTEITEAEKRLGLAKLTERSCAEAVKLRGTTVGAEAEGKSASEREADAVCRLGQDGHYQDAKRAFGQAGGVVVECEALLNQLKREWQALTLQIQFRIQVLAFLASPQ